VSTSEIRASIDSMTDEERFFAAAYLQHRAQEREPQYASMLTERMELMESGKKIPLEQAKRIHRALETEGL
jgi:hypothetical protein